MSSTPLDRALIGDSCTEYFSLQSAYRDSLVRHYGNCGHDSESIIQHALDGAIKLIDALALRDILRVKKPSKILEIGSFLGFSTRWILESTSSWNRTVTSLDPRVRHRIFNNLRKHVEDFNSLHSNHLRLMDAYFSASNEQMFLHDYMNYSPVMTQDQALAVLRSTPTVTAPFDTFDFIFIDGDHSFQATVDNVLLASKMLPAGGTIVVHDAISWPEVLPALQEISKSERLEFLGIAGTAFDQWITRHHHINALPSLSKCSRLLCDGLGLLNVKAP